MTDAPDRHRQLVLRVNEIFHDLEGKSYEDVHPEIFEREKCRWDRLLRAHIDGITGNRTFVDLGAGTGFVGERLLERMKADDTLVCADISAKMLAICSEKLTRLRPNITIRTLKLNDERIPLPDASADVLTMNSVLHHIPDAQKFLEECARILKVGGFLYIGHEPNSRFHTYRPLLRIQAALFRHLRPRRAIAKLACALGLYRPATVAAKTDIMLKTINEALKKEGLLDHPLTSSHLSQLIDVHSPTAGGEHRDEGFDPFMLLHDMSTFKIQHIETYNHLSKLSGRSLLFYPYEVLLSVLFPRDGAAFFLIAQKTA